MTTPPVFDRPAFSLKERFIGIRWGGGALVSLYISVISGVIVALQYNPAEPFYSTTVIELIAPYGSFWRAMHYYSSQAFLLLLICHFIAVVWENTHYYSRSTWVRLTMSLPVTILLLFTGYVLRDDATGEAAGLIAENIMLSIPIIGEWMNNLLLSITDNGVKRVYVNHIAGLMIAGGYCVWPHLRRYSTRWRSHVGLTCALLLLSIFLTAPIEPQRFGITHIAGPWFFLGLQEALRYVHPFWAGVVLPGIIVAALLKLPHKGKARFGYLVFIGLWLVFYGVLSGFSYMRI
ncbi:MAG: cytochrome b N-terminal domain-containing protein [Desulfobulbaceae bacterium]|jgi:ubiquinol-cytochrome c reductase cytochrome b subunit|nr:cytochrome b N-terminal domain-containing protein [Desulfobulbaceae bacterium]MDY0350722.1 cytochrome b N-terminal domain-containing protein [Desulfobulbaceae bacterium]